MAKRVEMTNRLARIQEAIADGDESIVRKYFSDPNNQEARWIFTQLGSKERDYIAKRAQE